MTAVDALGFNEPESNHNGGGLKFGLNDYRYIRRRWWRGELYLMKIVPGT
ncbi:MAG TPA: hypothetical protein VKB19_07200 [Pedobacter sp.]|nr:hypothetical protein [Pedobacter sp.]